MNSDVLFAARLYAVTYWMQRGRPATLGEVTAARGITRDEALVSVIGLDYEHITTRRDRDAAQRRTG